ncbi:MAG TPA: hypothetical protein DEP24_10475 [Mycobacterium sp.]|jgi:hypothetical protein|nr:hypothetical protein [Mycobacterium sp.]
MIVRGVLGVLLLAAVLVGCGSDRGPTADIAAISAVRASFGPQFTLTEIAPTGIDPRVLSGQKLPDTVTFEPPACARFATGQLVPSGTEGNMAAVSAEGEGNRFIVIAVQTNEAVPVIEPGSDCRKVAFLGGAVQGTVEAVEVPNITGTETIGVHRVLQTIVDGKPRTGEVYNYSAHFGDYQVIVSANPLVLPGQPVVAVNTQRARDLLIAGVNAIRR